MDNPTISGLIYPILQALDEEALDVHAQFGMSAGTMASGGSDSSQVVSTKERSLVSIAPRLLYIHT